MSSLFKLYANSWLKTGCAAFVFGMEASQSRLEARQGEGVCHGTPRYKVSRIDWARVPGLSPKAPENGSFFRPSLTISLAENWLHSQALGALSMIFFVLTGAGRVLVFFCLLW